MDVAVQSLLEYGLAGILLFAIGFALFKIGIWIMRKGDLVVDSHIAFVNNTDKRLGKMENDIDEIKEHSRHQEEYAKTQEEHDKKQLTLLEQIQRNTSNGNH